MNYQEEYYKLKDLLERFYISATAIDYEFCSETKTMNGTEYDKHNDVFIEVEKYLGIEGE